MAQLSRRRFLFASSGAAAGTFLVPGLALSDQHQEQETGPKTTSGLQTGRKIALRHKSVPGFLSETQMMPHYEAHYGGALRGYLAADERLQSGSADAAAFGSLHRARSSKGNSVVLHELYFDEMARKAPSPPSVVKQALIARWGSVDKWAADFVASANAASGWALLAFHPVNGKLYNVVSDTHDTGVLWMATPLIALDVYEHAYYLDYKNRKGDYVEKFMEHIDWREVGRRFEVTS